MGALASIASLVGAGATLYGNVRQAQAATASNKAQTQVAQQQEAGRQQALAVQSLGDSQARALTLTRTVAATRAKAASSGLSPDEGSAGALVAGLRQDAAAAQGSDDATFRARLAQGRANLLIPDGTLNAVLRSGRSLGAAARNLLD
jgi:hypothetical protein